MSETLIQQGPQDLTLEPSVRPEIQVGLLTGGQDRHYAFGLAMSLISRGASLDIIGSDDVDGPEMRATPKLNFLNLRGKQRHDTGLARKALRVSMYYARLLRYAAVAKPKIFHILWNNKFEIFDRTLLMLYYKLQGKKLVLTAHNVNAASRDSTDTPVNRFTLRMQYRLCDHVFVHTQKMKSELVQNFGVREGAVTVIPYGINNAVPDTDLTTADAKRHLGLEGDEKAILFFGRIRPYKGLEHLLAGYQQLLTRQSNYRLIIAGEPKKGDEKYLEEIQKMIRDIDSQGRIICKIKFIPDEEIELYLKAADVMVLPYRAIFQSGILFLACSFGLPVIAADVGSFRDEIVEGKNGFLCNPGDPVDLANAIERYFASDLYRNLENRRPEIRDTSNARHSWEAVGEMTRVVYEELLRKDR